MNLFQRQLAAHVGTVTKPATNLWAPRPRVVVKVAVAVLVLGYIGGFFL